MKSVSSQKQVKQMMKNDDYALERKRSKGYLAGYELSRWVVNQYGSKSVERVPVLKSVGDRLVENGSVVEAEDSSSRWPKYVLA